ncbi:MAG: SLBB domain-containing protein, partial [Saprospiraceae bacterium]|nr:SLBB domain-containing protein [Saprospiraceae bacterium]
STLTLQRAILLAGGLSLEASGRGLLLRTNPNNIKERAYLEVDLAAAFDQPTSSANVLLQPLDRLEVLSRPAFADETTIQVNGAVRKPGEFAYGNNMSLRDALLLAGGLRLEAARNRVDIFRIQIRDNEPTKTIVATLQIDSSFTLIGATPSGYRIQPFDEIVVRSVPEFEFQRYVELQGEVRYPGRYALLSNNERLVDIINRAGGLSPEAFKEGSSLYRQDGGKGFVVTNFKEALRNLKSPHNHILKEGDIIKIPKREDLVSIRTAYTQAADILKASIIANGLINVAYYPHKRAGWYIRHYAAGFGERAIPSRVSVERPNGKINRTIGFGFLIYPKVTKGSIISVAGKPLKVIKPTDPSKKKFDWDKALTQILATLGTLATVTIAAAALNSQ